MSSIAIALASLAGSLSAQGPAPAAGAVQQQAQLPPATKLEALKPSAGSVLTLGYNELGKLRGVSADVRELHDARGNSARGMLVEVTQSEYRVERSFVDADEIPELLRGIDALLDVKANPTRFENFEASYSTHGELKITAYNYSGRISYSIQAGRTLTADRVGLSDTDIAQFRAMVAKAQATLAAIGSK